MSETLIESTGTARDKTKLSKRLMPFFIVGFLATVIAVAFVQGGADLGQGAENRKRAEELERLKSKNYEDAVPGPQASAEAAAARAVEAARRGASRPTPGAPLPVEPRWSDEGVSQAEIERYETARRALARSTPIPGLGFGATTTTPSGPSSGPAGRQDAELEAPSRASFVSRVAVTGSEEGALSSIGETPRRMSTANAAAEPDSTTSDPRAVGRESAARLMEMQAKLARERRGEPGAGGDGGMSADGDASWLYAVQSREVSENKPLTAKITPGRHVIFAGTAIHAVLGQAVDTKLPGRVSARVTRDVFDSRYGRFLVVPRGATLTGAYRSAVTDGQSRVLMAFDRLITPAGGSVPLGGMPAADILGVGGVPGELHTHFLQRLGIATLLAVETAAIEKSVGSVGTVMGTGIPGQATSSAAGQIMLRTGNEELQRRYAVTPRVTIEAGAPITIISSADIEIAPVANLR